jgi:uncharacterized membrane protein
MAGLRSLATSHPRYRVFLVVLVAASLLLSLALPVVEAILSGFDLAVLAFVLSCVRLWSHSPPELIRREAERDDANRSLLLMITALISGVILTALGSIILDKQALSAQHVALLVATLLASWTFTNLVYAFHYARLYYSAGDTDDNGDRGDHGGLDFPGGGEPEFSDFVNFAFVIGMTCQTADIAITDRAMRRISTFHGLFAFAFNLGILALTVNVLASS